MYQQQQSQYPQQQQGGYQQQPQQGYAPQGQFQQQPQGGGQLATYATVPYENEIVLTGQVYPDQFCPNGFEWKTFGQGGACQINLKVRKETNWQGNSKLKVKTYRVVSGANIMNQLQPGMIVRVRGELEVVNYQKKNQQNQGVVDQYGQPVWAQSVQVKLPKNNVDKNGRPCFEILGYAPVIQEQSTPKPGQNFNQQGNFQQPQQGYQQQPQAGYQQQQGGYAPQGQQAPQGGYQPQPQGQPQQGAPVQQQYQPQGQPMQQGPAQPYAGQPMQQQGAPAGQFAPPAQQGQPYSPPQGGQPMQGQPMQQGALQGMPQGGMPQNNIPF